jgi:formate dehydrogenase maturation protein FdhE
MSKYAREVSLEVAAKCDGCGQPLNVTYASLEPGGIAADVEACDKCMDRFFKEGREEGYASGKADGLADVSQ